MKIIIFLLLLVSFNVFAGTTYYVKPGGNNNATGTSHASAWGTTGKVNSYNFQTGDDVYFESNGQWPLTASDGPITVDWSGTAQDRVIIGSYYWNGATEVIGVSGNKPMIQGNLAGINDINDCDTANGIPTSRFSGLIQIGTDSTPQDYVTVQDMQAINSCGRGIIAWNNGSDYSIIKNNTVQHTATAGIASRGYYTTFYNNEVSQAGLNNKYDPVTYTNSQPCLYLNGSFQVAEDNYVHECWYEGIGSYGVGSVADNNIIRGNTVVAARRVGIYLSSSENVIVENNKVLGDRTAATYTVGTPATSIEYFYASGWPGGALVSISEGISNPKNTNNNYFRNNLVSNMGRCIQVSCNATCNANGQTAEGYFYGNTCAGNNQNASISGLSGRTLVAKNNIFTYSLASGTSTDCDWSAAESTFDYNYWEDQPVDVDCRSANDVNTGLALNKTTGWTSVSLSDIPTDNDFKPSNTTVENQGIKLTTTVFNIANYADELLQPGCIFDVTEMSYEYDCGVRDTATDMGAFQFNGNFTPITYDEATQVGNFLYFLPLNQQTNVGELDVGTNTVTGNTAIFTNYRDSSDAFVFTVPTGKTLSSVNLIFSNVSGYEKLETYIRQISDINTPVIALTGGTTVDFTTQASPVSLFTSVLPIAGPNTFQVQAPVFYDSSGGNINMDYTFQFIVTN